MKGIIVRDYSDEYELVRAGAQPLSSCGELYDAWDHYMTRQFISYLCVTAEAWRSLLMHLGFRIPPNFYHIGEIYDAVAHCCMRGELGFYRLPKIEKLKAIPCGNGMGICFVKGPRAHCSTHLQPQDISNTQAATELLASITASDDDLVRFVATTDLVRGLCSARDGKKIIIEKLAAKEILAYKIPVYTNAPPKKQGELIPATGPGYDKVPLAPESKPVVKTEIQAAPQSKSAEPQTLGDAAVLLANSRKKLTETGVYQPKYSGAQLDAMAKEGMVAKERFIVTLQKTKTTNDAVGYQRPNGPTTAWTTTLDLIENADTDPELICDLNGMIYDPAAKYEIIIIDQGKYYKQDGAENFVPTYDRLKVLGKKEFSKQYTADQIDSVLTPEYTKDYKAAMDAYSKTGGKPWERKNINIFTEDYFKGDTKKQKQFYARNGFNTQVGCNEHFSGDGVTKTTGLSPYKLEEGKNGNLEMLLFEHNPETIGDLQKRGAALRFTANPIKRA